MSDSALLRIIRVLCSLGVDHADAQRSAALVIAERERAALVRSGTEDHAVVVSMGGATPNADPNPRALIHHWRRYDPAQEETLPGPDYDGRDPPPGIIIALPRQDDRTK